MISVKEELPIPNYMCRIKPTYSHYKGDNVPFRFITYSDGSGYFWDNLVDDVLNEGEVSHWEYWYE